MGPPAVACPGRCWPARARPRLGAGPASCSVRRCWDHYLPPAVVPFPGRGSGVAGESWCRTIAVSPSVPSVSHVLPSSSTAGATPGTPRRGQCWPVTCIVTGKSKRERLAAIWVFKTEKSLLFFMSKSKKTKKQTKQEINKMYL